MAALLIPGLVFFGALVLLAIAQTANVTAKSQNEAQTSVGQFFKDAITGKIYVKTATKLFRSSVSRWALAQIKPVAAWFIAVNLLVRDAFRQQTANMEATADAIDRLKGHTIPTAAKRAAAPAKTVATAAQKTANQVNTRERHHHGEFVGYRTRTTPKIAHATHAIDVTIPGQLGRIRTREDALSRDLGKVRDRTKALENGAVKTFEWIREHPFSLATGVFAGAVAIALSRLGFGFLRCRSWKNVGKRMNCGIGSLLGDLLAIGFAYTVIVDPVAIAKAANEAEDVMDSIIRQIAK